MISSNAETNFFKMNGIAKANTTPTSNQMVNSVRLKEIYPCSSIKNMKNRAKLKNCWIHPITIQLQITNPTIN